MTTRPSADSSAGEVAIGELEERLGLDPAAMPENGNLQERSV